MRFCDPARRLSSTGLQEVKFLLISCDQLYHAEVHPLKQQDGLCCLLSISVYFPLLAFIHLFCHSSMLVLCFLVLSKCFSDIFSHLITTTATLLTIFISQTNKQICGESVVNPGLAFCIISFPLYPISSLPHRHMTVRSIPCPFPNAISFYCQFALYLFMEESVPPINE